MTSMRAIDGNISYHSSESFSLFVDTARGATSTRFKLGQAGMKSFLEIFFSEINDKEKEVLMFRMAYGRNPPCLPDVAEIYNKRFLPQRAAKLKASPAERFHEREYRAHQKGFSEVA